MYQTKENGTIQSLPYDKFLQQGAENLTEEELIAIILRTGTRGEDALTLACRVYPSVIRDMVFWDCIM